MVLRQLATECKDGVTCASVWEDDAADSVVVVGELVDPSPVPLGSGEQAVRLPRHVLGAANLR